LAPFFPIFDLEESPPPLQRRFDAAQGGISKISALLRVLRICDVVRKIERDANRFKQIVRGKIKADLRKYITHGEMIGKTGGELVSIPMPQIEIPEFRYGHRGSGGVGQGPGETGTPIGRAGDREGDGEAGDAPGQHILEVELTLEELAQILGEEL